MANEKNKNEKKEAQAKKDIRETRDQENAIISEKEAVSELKQQLTKRFGTGSVFTGTEGEFIETAGADVISTGIISLDAALGIGGLPKGRIIEIYGPESSGKTTLTLNMIAKCQAAGGIAAFIDAEHALDVNFAKKIGVDLSNLLISQPGSGEECFDICTTLIKSGAVSLVVIDSVAAMVPRAEIEGNAGEVQIGLQARLMTSGLRRITSLAANNGCTVIFINQLRDKIGVTFGSSETTPGGRALKFFSSVRMDIRKIDILKNAEIPVGLKTRVKITKNKCAMPFKTAELDLLFNEGISYEGDLIDMAISRGIMEKNGAWYSYANEKIGQGKENTRIFLKGNAVVCRELETLVRSAMTA